MRNAVNFCYLTALVIAAYNSSWNNAIIICVIILWDIIDSYKEKASREYIEWLEKDRERWRTMYIEEKFKKTEDIIKTKQICEN